MFLFSIRCPDLFESVSRGMLFYFLVSHERWLGLLEVITQFAYCYFNPDDAVLIGNKFVIIKEDR